MNSTLLSTRLFVLLLFVGLLGAGCDSGSTGGGGGLIAPNSSEIPLSVKPDSSQTKSFTLSYRGLNERPQADTENLPSAYQIEATGETGSPSDGTSSFDVTFNGPSTPGDYATPVRFRAGGTTATMRLAGAVVRVFPVATYEDGTTTIVPFGGPSAQIQNGELLIQGTDLGGELVFPGVATILDATTDFSNTPVVAARIKVASSSEDGPAILRAALNTEGGQETPNANRTVDALVKEIPADGEYATYYFDFRGNFVNFNGVEADASKITEVVFLINDNNPDTFTGSIFVDEISRRQNIPSDGS